MRLTTSRVGRRPLVLLSTLFTAFTAFAALSACADEQPPTAPSTRFNAPRAAADVAPAAEDDSTRLTITLDRATRVYPAENAALIEGTLTCSRARDEEIVFEVRVQQKQPGRVLGEGVAEKRVRCLTTFQQPWGVYVPAYAGYFDAGKASASVRVLEWTGVVVPTTATGNVRLNP